MSGRPFEAALFDFGGVFTASPFAAAHSLGEGILERVFGPYERDTDHPWHRLERGEISLLEAREAIVALGREDGLDTDPFRVFAAMRTEAGARKEVVASVERLRARGLRTALVTNNVREFKDRWREMIRVDALFHHVVDSSEVGVRKPDPAIFRMALGAVGAAPERCVFLDDHEGNVRAARALGIHGILVGDDPSDALAELEALTRS